LAKGKRLHPPALTPEAREDQLVAEAVDLAEKQIQSGKASSQVICHYLRLGSSKAKLENEKLKEENKLLRAKTEAIQSQKKVEQLYSEALDAMRSYSGQEEYEEKDDS
jgi:uncharacterized protein YcaQ